MKRLLLASCMALLVISSCQEKDEFEVLNAQAAKEVLASLGIPIIGEDTGGSYGRTVSIDLSNGVYKVKTIDKGEKEI